MEYVVDYAKDEDIDLKESAIAIGMIDELEED